MSGRARRTGSWRGRAGAWLAIGTSPATLLLGAQLGDRHDAAVPATALLLGVPVISMLLYSQGLFGLPPPMGDGASFSKGAQGYLSGGGLRALNVLLAGSMAGWFGFNVGLGGAALAALAGLGDGVGVLLLGLPVVALSLAGMHRWNAVAVVTTCAALALGLLATAVLAEAPRGVVFGLQPARVLWVDLAAFTGYAAVFSVRAPDFSAGLGSRRDLRICVALLVVPTVCMVLAGIGLQAGTGSGDIVEVLATRGSLSAGNALVTVAVIAPSFTTLHSGALALRAFVPRWNAAGVLLVAVPGLMLAVLRFDRVLSAWLIALAALLPPLVVAMGVEGARRRRGGTPRRVPAWTWLPAALLGACGVALDRPSAVPAALLATLALSVGWAWWSSRRPRDRWSPPPTAADGVRR